MTRPSVNYRARRNAAPVKPEGAENCPRCDAGWLQYLIAADVNGCPKCGYHTNPTLDASEEVMKALEPFPYPAHWTKGQLLNVRHNGSTYILTTLEEEFDPHYPERAKFFDNSFDCQAFVSSWYSRDAADPRA